MTTFLQSVSPDGVTYKNSGEGWSNQNYSSNLDENIGSVSSLASLSYQPWQFTVASYGAKGNGKVVTDGAMSSSSNTTTLTCSTSNPFSSGDVGKYVIVNGAGAVSGESLVATISSFVSSSQVVLSGSAGQTVSGATVCFGSDDTAAFQSAINAAVSYAQSSAFYAEVIVSPSPSAFYMIAGSLVTGGSTHGNSQITLPVIATGSNKITLVLKGSGDASPLAHWQQPQPELSGSNIVSTGVFANATAQSNSINANGNPCIIGGPAQPAGYGTSGTLYSNMCIILDGIRLIVPMSQNGYAYCGFDFSGVAAARLSRGGCDSTATYDSEWQAHNMGAAGFNFGGLMPANGNNDKCPIDDWAVGGGFVYGIMLTEHCNAECLRILYCWTALAVSGSYWSSTGLHAIHIGQFSTEACTNSIKFFGSGANGVGPYLDIDQLDWEGASTINLIDDDSGVALAAARGTIKITGEVPTGITVNGVAQSVSAQTGLKILFSATPIGVWSSPPSVPSNNTAQVNTSYRDATIYITSGGAAVSAIKVDSTATGLTLGTTGTVAVRLLPGHSITLTYASTAPTWVWVLE